MEQFSSEEYMALSAGLEQHHSIFQKLWSLGRPHFTNKVQSASARFDPVGEDIDFAINPDFWATKSQNQKMFILAHECLHMVLNHGLRIRGCGNKKLANDALDIVVNHSLVDRFGFVRSEVDPYGEFCWIDTIFPKQDVETNKSFEYYYNLLEASNQSPSDSNDHDYLSDFSSLILKLDKELSVEDKAGIQDLVEKQAGTEGGNDWTFVDISRVKVKRKWETVITKWAKRQLKEQQEEQWARAGRRLTLLPNDLFIPSDSDADAFEKSKIEVWFFQDTSGSCAGFRDRFFKAAASLPKDRFDIKMHCFDTRVFETTLESGRLYGFGGTSFNCIESYIQNYMRTKMSKYPAAVFIITDGYGDYVRPERPNRWHWFLSHDYRLYVPKESKVFMLRDFE